MLSKLPSLETIAQLGVAALFTVFVLGIIGFMGWTFKAVNANEVETETAKTKYENILEEQKKLVNLFEQLNLAVSRLDTNLSSFKIETNKEITDIKIENNNESFRNLVNNFNNQNDIKILQEDYEELKNLWVSTQ